MSKTPYKKLQNTTYLGSHDLVIDDVYGELTLTIESVDGKKVLDPKDKTRKKEKDVVVVGFKNSKPMIANPTNQEAISKALGSIFIEDWIGKKITLHAPVEMAFGEKKNVLRVKPVPPQKPELTPSHARWAAAKDAIGKGEATLESIKNSYRLSPANEKLLKG